MNYILEILQQTRQNFLQLVDKHSLEELNHIPQGYNNNIIWNFGHTIITQQMLCYKLAGLTPLVNDDLIHLYRKGTKPEKPISQAALDELKELAVSTLEILKKDLKEKDFSQFQSYTTSYGTTLNHIEEVIQFNTVHEGLHYGYAMAQARLLYSI